MAIIIMLGGQRIDEDSISEHKLKSTLDNHDNQFIVTTYMNKLIQLSTNSLLFCWSLSDSIQCTPFNWHFDGLGEYTWKNLSVHDRISDVA